MHILHKILHHSQTKQHIKLHRQQWAHCTQWIQHKKSEDIPATGRGGLWSYEKSRIHDRLTDGGQTVHLTLRPRFSHRNLPVFISVADRINPVTMVSLEVLRGTEKIINDTTGIWTLDLPACSVAPQPCMLQFIHTITNKYYNSWKITHAIH
jgi:hypothetical protein